MTTSNLFRALVTPSFSTTSSVSLSPAVSLSSTGYPPMFTGVSITSRVVPAISVTIAAGLWPTGYRKICFYNKNNFHFIQCGTLAILYEMKSVNKFSIFFSSKNSWKYSGVACTSKTLQIKVLLWSEILILQIIRPPDTVHNVISLLPMSSQNPMFDHLLESSHLDNWKKGQT